MPTVTIDGETPEALIDVKDDSQTDNLGSATIIVGATRFNRTTFESGDSVVISRGGGGEWTGYLTGKPSATSEGTLELEAMDSRYVLKKSNVSRPFFERDSGEIVRQVTTTEAQERGDEDIHRGSELAGWKSDMEVFELGNLATKKLHEKGSDILFGGIREGGTGTYSLTYTDVPARAAPGRAQLYKLVTRLLVNGKGGQIALEVELVSEDGTSMLWKIDSPPSDFEVLTLALEDAVPGDLSSPGTLEYRFDISGSLTDNTGIAIDYATAYPFKTESRETTLDTSGVRDTGRAISRRFDQTALEVLQDMETEENYQSWVDADEVLYFEPAGSQQTELAIREGETRVTSAEFNRDYDNIVNEVKVQGDGVQENVKDSESIRFYGLSSRDEPIVDEAIKTSAEARDRGNGYLAKKAWEEVVATFEIADSSYQTVEKGASMVCDWPSADFSGEFVVTEKSVATSGIVTLGLGVRT